MRLKMYVHTSNRSYVVLHGGKRVTRAQICPAGMVPRSEQSQGMQASEDKPYIVQSEQRTLVMGALHRANAGEGAWTKQGYAGAK